MVIKHSKTNCKAVLLPKSKAKHPILKVLFFTPEMLAKIDKSVEEAKEEGKLKTFATKKELHTYLDSL